MAAPSSTGQDSMGFAKTKVSLSLRIQSCLAMMQSVARRLGEVPSPIRITDKSQSLYLTNL
jgi:hypothetical protein